MDNDSVKKTLIVAVVLCIFFSVIVSYSAVGLKPLQVKNRELDVKKNILSAAGIKVSGEKNIEEEFSKVETFYIELPSGNIRTEINDKSKAELAERVIIDPSIDLGKIYSRPKYLPVYLIKDNSVVTKVILPIVSKGLWSTMFAFMALDGDANTIEGLEYYIQGETPGLGAEVTNPKWKAQWAGKKVYLNEEVAINILKPGMSRNQDYDIDGISGATITSVGVANSLKYWLGSNGYKNFLDKVRGGEL